MLGTNARSSRLAVLDDTCGSSLRKLVAVVPQMTAMHMATYNALSRSCARRGVELIVAELTDLSNKADWQNKMLNASTGWRESAEFDFRTLLKNHVLESVPGSLVWQRLQGLLVRESPQAVFFTVCPASRGAIRWLEDSGMATVAVCDQLASDFAVARGESRFGYLWKVPPFRLMVYTAHWRRLSRRFRPLKHYDAVIVGGPVHMEFAVSLGIPRHKVFPGYWVVDNEMFASAARSYRQDESRWRREMQLPEKYFLVVARLNHHKNLVRLFRAYAAYRGIIGNDAWDLIVCGCGPDESALRSLIARERIEGITLAGHKTPDKLTGYYALASAFMLPSTSEPWGLVVNEAMASGLPVLLTSHCGAIHLLADGINGWKFNPFDGQDILRAMCRMSRLPDGERRAMGTASMEIMQHWGPDRFSAAVLSAVDAAMYNHQVEG